MSIGPKSRILVAGAGSVGCYVGGCLARAGRHVTFLLRAPLAEALSRHGMRISALDDPGGTIPGDALELTTAAEDALGRAGVVLVTVKSGATRAMGTLIAAHAPGDAVVVSLQNGTENAAVLRAVVGGRRVIAGMVPFNVVQTRGEGRPPHFHRATSGTIQIGPEVPGLRELLDVPGVAVAENADMPGVLWSKLVINLNNALNALAGIPLRTELADRRWRLILALQIEEALAVLKRADIPLARLEGVHPRLLPIALRLPDRLFRLIAGGMLRIDSEARSSMWDDLQAGRRTEIDHLQGAFLALAERHGLEAPTIRRVAALVKDAEKQCGAPKLSPDTVDPTAKD